MSLFERLDELASRVELNVVDPGVETGPAEMIANLAERVAPLELPTELVELYNWIGGSDVYPSVEGVELGRFFAPRSAFQILDLPLEVGSPAFPRNLLPIASDGPSFALAEIDPASSTCRVWDYNNAEPDVALYYPTIGHLIEAASAVASSPRLYELVDEDGHNVFDAAVAATFHPEMFHQDPGERARPRTICSLDDPAPPNRSSWPEHWITPWPNPVATDAGRTQHLPLGGLDNMNLNRTDLRDVDLRGRNLRNSNLRGANLTNASLTSADLTGADISVAAAINTNLVQAELAGASFGWTVFFGANLNGANLTRADLAHANLNGSSLTEADLTSANLHAASLRATNLTAATLNGADLSNIDASGARFTRSSLAGANLSRSRLGYVDFTGTNLTNTDLREAVIGNANFEGAYWQEDQPPIWPTGFDPPRI